MAFLPAQLTKRHPFGAKFILHHILGLRPRYIFYKKSTKNAENAINLTEKATIFLKWKRCESFYFFLLSIGLGTNWVRAGEQGLVRPKVKEETAAGQVRSSSKFDTRKVMGRREIFVKWILVDKFAKF